MANDLIQRKYYIADTEDSLPSEIVDGSIYYVKGNNALYIDMSSTRRRINPDYSNKLDANQGSINAGKSLSIDDNGNVIPVENINIDPTFKNQGQAADAKITGQALGELYDYFEGLQQIVENLDDSTTVTTDTTLSNQGVPADAKATGDRLTSIQSELNVLEPTATASDVGKTLKVKTVANGKVSKYELGDMMIDNTLTQTGWAADAKKVGSELSSVKDEVRSESQARTTADNALREDINDDLAQIQAQISSVYGAPSTASTVAQMTDHTKAYVYTGEESGYTTGNWYYWNGSSWVSGGVYNAVAIQTDKSLTLDGKAADAKTVGDELSGLKDDLTEIEDDINDVYALVPAVVEESVSSFFSNTLSNYSVDQIASSGLLITLHSNTSYDSYYLYPSRSCSLWFASTPSASYVALAKIENASAIYLPPEAPTVYRIDGTNAVRYRKSESNLPTESNKLSLSVGMAVLITIPKSVSADDVTFMVDYGSSGIDKTLFNNLIKLNTTQINQVKQTNYVEYVSGTGDDSSTEHINVYLGQNNGFIKYEFLHSVSASINSNIWRLGRAKYVNDSFTDVASITVSGEWECALKIAGRSDFAGGILHGDEVVQSITFLIDGKVKTISSISGKVQFDKLQIIQKSNMYDPNDSTTVFAIHTSLHEFTDKLKIKQSVIFSGSYTMDVSYLAMFPISKTYSENYYTDQNYEYQTIAIPVFQRKAREVSLFGGGIASTFALKEQTENLNSGGLSILDNGGNPYNKCYFGVCDTNTEVASGDIWKATTYYVISA